MKFGDIFLKKKIYFLKSKKRILSATVSLITIVTKYMIVRREPIIDKDLIIKLTYLVDRRGTFRQSLQCSLSYSHLEASIEFRPIPHLPSTIPRDPGYTFFKEKPFTIPRRLVEKVLLTYSDLRAELSFIFSRIWKRNIRRKKNFVYILSNASKQNKFTGFHVDKLSITIGWDLLEFVTLCLTDCFEKELEWKFFNWHCILEYLELIFI